LLLNLLAIESVLTDLNVARALRNCLRLSRVCEAKVARHSCTINKNYSQLASDKISVNSLESIEAADGDVMFL